jgi:23S rRNA pseudouridine1911/1915/1917 synthase
MEKEKRQEEIVVSEEAEGERLDVFLTETFGGDLSRSQVKKLIDGGQVQVDDVVAKPRLRLQPGMRIIVDSSEVKKAPSNLTPVEMPLDILFEDDSVLVLNKKAGVVVHPGAGTTGPTLVEGVLYHFGHRDLMPIDVHTDRPGIVHRLDKDTTGALVIAKNTQVHRDLAKQFEEKSNLREYLALMIGHVKEDEFTIKSYLGRNPKDRRTYVSISEDRYGELEEGEQQTYRHAVSHFKVKRRYVVGQLKLTLANIQLSTGRTHQIRVHAASLGHGVWGDPMYGGRGHKYPEFLSNIKRQLLHARYLGFHHSGRDENIAFEADLPEDFQEVLKKLGHDTQKSTSSE